MNALDVRNAEPRSSEYRISDGQNLYLLVRPDGGKYWRFIYRFDGKQRSLALGPASEMSLKDARTARDAARALLRQGIDPAVQRRAERMMRVAAGGHTVESVAREWLESKHRREVCPVHYETSVRRLEMHVFPKLGHRPIATVEPADLLDCLHKLARADKVDTAYRVKVLCGQIWRYAIPSKRVTRDIAADLRDALPSRTGTHLPAITEPVEFGKLLLALETYRGMGTVGMALKLSPLLFVRPGELRQMEWKDIRLEDAEWDFTPSKGGTPMISPLSGQAVEILRQCMVMRPNTRFVFGALRNRTPERPMSENTVNDALKALGYNGIHCAHGFRAAARTMLDEQLGFPVPVIEMQLAHAVRDTNGRAYNRTSYLPQRREMMQAWADYLDQLRQAAQQSAT